MTRATTPMPEHNARAYFAGDARAMPTNVHTYGRNVPRKLGTFSCSYFLDKRYLKQRARAKKSSRTEAKQ